MKTNKENIVKGVKTIWTRKAAGLMAAAALAISLTGCGAANNNNDASGSTVNSSEGLTVGEDLATGQDMYLFGKIGEIVGNEVTIQLAKMPEVEEPPAQESGSGEDLPMGDMSATLLVPAQPAGSVDAGGGMDMEFTGENVKINVPAGLDIRDSAGQPITVNALTKGNVIQFTVDNMDDLNLKSIIVME